MGISKVMSIGAVGAVTVTLITTLFAPAAVAGLPGRERSSLDANWLFIKNDPPGLGNELTYTNIKPWVLSTANAFVKDGQPVARPGMNMGKDIIYVQRHFKDTGWQSVNLPNDWGIEGPFNINDPGETGKLPWYGVGWYRKHFEAPQLDDGRHYYLDVDGAMSYANVWINGYYVGGWPYGYASWEVDLTRYIHFNGDNVVAIRLDNPKESSRWYPGGGIYRNVWLVKTAPVHVAHWGTYVTTPDVDAKAATVNVRFTINNDSRSAAHVSVRNDVCELKSNGKPGWRVASVTSDDLNIAALDSATLESQLKVSSPRLWSLEHPQQYVVVTTVEQDGETVDSYQTPFGIRTIRFDADNGFFLNGKHVKLNGVCDHSDLGALGTAVNESALERQIEILKEMGCNAIRTSHNPPAPELLDLCDRMGVLVMDESFDCWRKGKRPNDYHLLFNDWHERDWRAELRRDRNHPSIILWSIGNEVPDQGTKRGPAIAAELTRIAHEEDPTRPTTAACDHIDSGFDGFQTNLDVFGYNYKPFKYADVHQANPGLPIFGSETASTISSRGEYFYPVQTNADDGKQDFQMSSYDLSAPHWATTPDREFAGQDENPFVAGEFVWTGFDYLGEPTPFYETNAPSRSSYFGIVDLAGFKKDRFYLYQARWRPDFPMAHIVPQCWNWPGREGQVTPVYVYTSGDEAELFLNGKSLGRQTKGQSDYRLKWDDVTYQPGELKVVAYRKGRKWANDVVHTAGPAEKLVVTANTRDIDASRDGLCFVTVTVEDKQGFVVPDADNQIHFDISGPGQIAATDNGDPTDLTSFPSPDRKAFHGLALAIVRGTQSGGVTIEASSPGLKSGSVSIGVRGSLEAVAAPLATDR